MAWIDTNGVAVAGGLVGDEVAVVVDTVTGKLELARLPIAPTMNNATTAINKVWRLSSGRFVGSQAGSRLVCDSPGCCRRAKRSAARISAALANRRDRWSSIARRITRSMCGETLALIVRGCRKLSGSDIC
jgi:hypothetical protein